MAQTKIKAGLFEGIIGNGTDGYFLMSNGDGTMTWSSVIINPTITSIAYPGSVTAADPAGGETITVTGTGFKTGATVTVGGTAAPAVSYVSATQITFTTPAKVAGDYDIVVTNTDTGSATYINGISYNGIPSWTTAAGSLGTFASNETISTITLQATEPDAGTITFNITNGALPTGLSLTGTNIDGTTSLETADTLYTFTVTATDDESQATPRTFTITVQKQFISTDNFTINTYDGTSSTQSIEGKIGTAADFNGSNSSVSLPFNLQNTAFSISFWAKNTLDSNNYYLIANGSGSTQAGWLIGGANSSGTVYNFRINNGSTNYLLLDSATVDDSDWHHVVITWDNTTNTNGAKIYINGSLSSQGTSTSSTNFSFTNSTIQLMAEPGGSLRSDGKLDQVRFFNKAISSSEVTTLYGESNTSTTKSTTDIFDDGSGVALYEFEKGAIDTGGTNGYIGSAGVFNGSNGSLDIVSGPLIQNNIESFSFWFKDKFVFGFYNPSSASSSDRRRWFIDNTTSGSIKIQVNNDQYNYEQTGITEDSNWHHLVVSSNGYIYLDGTALTNQFNTSYWITDGTNGTARDTIRIGSSDYIGAASSGYIEGSIDQVRIFNKALSSSEVTTLYGETSASATKSTTDIFDDGSGVALYELEGNANDTGRGFEKSAVFNGSTSNINFGNVLNTTFESNWSVSAWINFNSGTSGAILQKGPNILNGEYIRLYTRSSTPRIQFGYSDGSTNGVDMSTNSYDPGGKGWVHVVGTADYSGSFKLYVNGSLVETQNVTGGAPSFSMTDPLYIGYNSGGGGYVDGNIDDVRLYSSVLTSTDVEYLYKNDTSNIPTANLTSHWKLDGNANDSIGSINGTETDITYNDGVAYNGTATNVTYAYDGTPTNVSFVGTAFQPDFVWLKSRTQVDNHYLQDAVRGATRRLHSNLTVAEQSPDSNRFTSFDSYGFTVGSDNSVNMTGHDYVAWCWKAASSDSTNTDGTITSTVRANQDAGFSIVKYTGSSGNTSFGTGLSSEAEFIIFKRYTSAQNWFVFVKLSGVWHYLEGLNNTNAAVNYASSMSSTSTTVTLPSLNEFNQDTNSSYIAYCFHSVDGYQKVGSYNGNGGANSITGLGFTPRFVLFKCTSAAYGWILLDSTRGSSVYLLPNDDSAEGSTWFNFSFDLDGWSVNTTNRNVNGSSDSYLYLAIA